MAAKDGARDTNPKADDVVALESELTLYQPAVYEIKVPGALDKSRSEWAGGMEIAVKDEGEGRWVTILSGTVVDQAALQGLLRRLYSLGLPLISVVCVEFGSKDNTPVVGEMIEMEEIRIKLAALWIVLMPLDCLPILPPMTSS
jgi:hypothetical protein